VEEKSSLNIPSDNLTPLMDSSSGSQDKKSKENDRREAKGSPFSCFALFCLTFVHCLF
jgi:hypothetical protein